MKWMVYNLLFAAVYPFLLPGFLLRMLRRGGYAARFWDRFALYPNSLLFANDSLSSGGAQLRGRGVSPRQESESSSSDAARRRVPEERPSSPIWIHAVSVGEVQVAGQLMREWRKADPSVRFVFSTTSSTGWKMAEREIHHCPPPPTFSTSSRPDDILIYNPLDFPNFVKSALKTFRPRAIVLTESEIWPNFIRKAHQYGIPLYLINARVSDRSAPRYKMAKWFFGDVFRCFTKIFAQSQLDADRLIAAGAPADRVLVTGSFKFDVAHRNEAKEKELAEWVSSASRPKILLGGSTWPGEDEVLLRIYRKLVDAAGRRVPINRKLVDAAGDSFADAAGRRVPILIIAPRHFEKADAVEANIRAAGFTCLRRSVDAESRFPVDAESFPRQLEDNHHSSRRGKDSASTGGIPPVYLADTTGELMGLYGIADVVFVGKSLCAHGSQNMIEPCLCGKPTFVGPYTENFRPVMSDLLASKAIVQVQTEAELTEQILACFDDPEKGRELGARARAAVASRCGVVAKCLEEIMFGLNHKPTAEIPEHA